ncbi:LysR family transcriptional regulator [Hahella sp. CR1]|uniref:LysR family transcriptional regulator n=1 Tax=Hahella sp. CR1 TaxID=2992807 RepID=UPI002442236F|nr:LysR family transcriptional regulator [Hahella sp. CR1]MDG9668675.1 LysR family transcriptional regulator [Hahella sp. CR1]
MDTVTSMKAFCAVVQEGGFSAAGRKLNLSKVLVSKYVGQLEDRLGARLFHRTTRKVRLTPTGEAYYLRVTPLLHELDDIEARVRDEHGEPEGLLRVAAPTSFAEIHLMPLVAIMLDKHPGLTLDIRLADRYVDLLEEQVDLAVRIGYLPDSSLVAQKLADIPIVWCASATYLERHGTPQIPADLMRHRVVFDSNYSGGDYWPVAQEGGVARLPLHKRVSVNSARAAKELALSGMGLARLPAFVIGDELASGKLRPVLQKYWPDASAVYAVYPHRRHLSARVRLFVEEAKVYFSTNPPTPPLV